ncbi:hypothetical protein E3N88_32923 [Mikania micrantha]|uniref:Uncharacterized protein n=1 Tax=Mikania micrantha TaxID=192012 RepID=A0A5N6MAI5_9ASTR|nr:hypothetical protein E3N88_32923 [Mikania micrantha]
MSQEWCTSQDLFFLYCLLSGRPCNLAQCLAEYFSTYYHRQERGLIYEGVYVTRIARFNRLIDLEPAGMEAFHPVHLDRRTVQGMRIVQKFPQLGLRFSLEKGVSKDGEWVPVEHVSHAILVIFGDKTKHFL